MTAKEFVSNNSRSKLGW